ncbi:hypothetical protein ACN8ZM_18355 [Burkholderia aenigmatica]|uniref:hypothetical protein n=1 Tax=Burkholderia aenigmatica TaxID=2015348 RepID=UPI003B43A4D3
MHDRVAAEQAVTEWIARSVWGNGRNSSYFERTPLNPYEDDYNELKAFYKLFLKPIITTDVQVLNSIGALTIPGAGLGELRRITVTFPGWKSQISKYKVKQVRGALGTIATYEDPALVVEQAGVGVLTLSSDTLVGRTDVEYWPNDFTEPQHMLPSRNYL